MLRIDRARAIPRGLGILLVISFTIAGCGGVLAKSRIKKSLAVQPSWEAPVADVTPQPVRFFTINAVLAKHDGLSHAASGAVQLASVDGSSAVSTGIASDTPVTIAITSEEPFGLFTFRAPEGLLWTKWRGVDADAPRGQVGRRLQGR